MRYEKTVEVPQNYLNVIEQYLKYQMLWVPV